MSTKSICGVCNANWINGEWSQGCPECDAQFTPRRSDPVDEFEDLDTALDDDVQEWIDTCNDILEACDDVPEHAEDFALSVSEKIEDMRDWMILNRRVTEGMKTAIGNMQAGLETARNGE